MIKSNEIRVGNKIKGTAMGLTITVDLHFFNECYDDDTMLDWYTGIVLTPDILEKCGFEEEYKSEWTIKYTLKIDSRFGYDWNKNFGWRVRFIGECLRNITYLHQLQNLVHALTGEELNVNL